MKAYQKWLVSVWYDVINTYKYLINQIIVLDNTCIYVPMWFLIFYMYLIHFLCAYLYVDGIMHVTLCMVVREELEALAISFHHNCGS